MAARQGMTMRMKVERGIVHGTDPYHNDSPPEWKQHYGDLACSAWEAVISSLEAGAIVRVRRIKAIVPVNADVTMDDRVAKIMDRSYETVFAGTLTIEDIVRRRSHLELTLKRAEG